MRAIAERLVAVFQPTGMALYDIAIPAAVVAAGCILLAVLGVISENAAFWCFGVGALIHVSLSWLAGFLVQGKEDGKHQGKTGQDRG